jgi:hypothetical protein
VKPLQQVLTAAISFSLVFSIAAQCSDSSSAAGQTVSKKTAATQAAQCRSKAVSADTAKQPVKTSAAAPGKTSQDTLIILARLIEIPGKFAPNDLYNYVYIMKYRIIKVLKGSYAAQEILVGHYNPLIPRPQIRDNMAPVVRGNVARFETGAKHKLTLVTPVERVWKDAVEDDYADSDLDKYFALKADVAQ